MTMLVRYVVLAVVFVAFAPAQAQAACRGAVPNLTAANGNDEGLIECIAAASTARVTTINIPAGSFVINSAVSVPDDKAIIFQGAGTRSTLIDVQTNRAIDLNLSPSRITGIGFTCSGSCSNMIRVSGKGWRIDHNSCTTALSQKTFVFAAADSQTSYPVTGLVDHNVLNRCRVDASGDFTGTSVARLNAWFADPGFGNIHAVYVEDNDFLYDPVGWNGTDCQRGGLIVIRHNVVSGTSLETHSFQGQAACRRFEAYRNTLTANRLSTPPMVMRGGPQFIFQNAFSGFLAGKRIIRADNVRSQVNTDAPTRYGGLCDGDDERDGNDGPDGPEKGWKCRDQIGTWKNQRLGTATTWPEQDGQPTAYWLNTGLDNEVQIATNSQAHIKGCRDIVNTDASFDGTCPSSTLNRGVGSGLRSARPSTCQVGVYYWSTDQGGNWDTLNGGANDGALDYCSATNTWTNSFYVPLVYPHPLQGGGSDTTD